MDNPDEGEEEAVPIGPVGGSVTIGVYGRFSLDSRGRVAAELGDAGEAVADRDVGDCDGMREEDAEDAEDALSRDRKLRTANLFVRPRKLTSSGQQGLP